MMQSEELASLPVGTEVSAKYKGAFCEAKVKKVHRNVICKISFKQGGGNFDLLDSQLTYTGNLAVNSSVEAKHPDQGGSLQEAIVTKIFDKSQYTVVFDDGDIATLRRNALRMKSGKHFNASESLDNLPLTHPEHFGTPVGSKRRKFGEEDEEEEDSTDDEAESVPYISKLGTVVCVEVDAKKSSKVKENWFPGLIVSPYSQDQVKINTKEDFLVRSFKDHRYYTVPKTECKKFNKDLGKGVTDQSTVKAIELAVAYQDNSENLPVHWDKDILFDMRDESTTEGESEDEELLLSDEDDTQSPEEKDHLVAELYKHMDDRGSPINKTPSIGDHDVDLYKLFKFVQKLGGTQRVTNNNQWRIVAKKLGFETNWCVNQVKVIYRRYLHSFEELYRTLGCTLINHPRNSLRVRHGSGRPLMRGVRTGSKVKEEDGCSDKSSVSSQEGGDQLVIKKEEVCDEIDLDGVKQKPEIEEKKVKKNVIAVQDKIIKEEALDEETEIFDASKKGKDNLKGKKVKEERMLTRPRRDSSSSLAAATELKAKKDEIGESSKVRKEVIKKEVKKIKEEDDKSDSGSNGSKGSKPPRRIKKKEPAEEVVDQDDECNSDLDNVGKKKKVTKKKGGKSAELPPVQGISGDQDGEEPQHLKPSVECSLGDKIKVFWRHGQIYEAKIIKVDRPEAEKWPKYYVHYQGWNQRYDEWITRGRIAENLTWNANPKKSSTSSASSSSKSSTPPPETKTKTGSKVEKRSSDEDEKEVSDERAASESEEKEPETRRKVKAGSNRSSTPSSTPGSSRTSSPAHNKRTKSPAPKRPISPKEKTPLKEKSKGLLPRTNSPAQRRSPVLKRQSSRNSLNKQSDDDFEMSEEAEDDDADKSSKKTAKAEKDPVPEVKVETPKRAQKNAATTPKSDSKVKSKASEQTIEKEEEKKVEHSKPVLSRSRRSATPTKKMKETDNDPYIFQEPEPMEPFVKIENISAADIAKHSKTETSKLDSSAKAQETSEAIVDETKTEEIVPEPESIKVEDIKQEEEKSEKVVPVKSPSKEEPSKEKVEPIKEEVKEEIDEEKKEDKTDANDKKGSSFDRYASLFPHLVQLRSGPEASATTPDTTASNNPEIPETSSDPEVPQTNLEITSANVINSIVESSILKETMDSKTSSSDDKKDVKDSSPNISTTSKEIGKDPEAPPKQRTGKKKSRKVRNLRNPTHKSHELVPDSDTDSEEEKNPPKPKPMTPRKRKEEEKTKASKRMKDLDSDEEESPASKRAKKRKEEDDESLVCEETLPGSPVQPSSSDQVQNNKSSNRDDRGTGSRVEMPFASVAREANLEEDDNKMGSQPSLPTTTALKISDSPPATPESTNSVDIPLIRSRKDELGRKSPAESSEVDLESLSGRGKAGSEDSRLDVEVGSSSSDSRLRPGRSRRHGGSKDVDKSEDKTSNSAKRKRKSRGDSSGRGRGKSNRGRNSSGLGRAVVGGRNNDESDDSGQDGGVIDEQRLERLDNDALADLAKPKPNSTSKYNFYVMLNPDMNATERISKLQKTIEDLRKTYLNIKGDLNAIERRRKKIRRKERERNQNTTEVAA